MKIQKDKFPLYIIFLFGFLLNLLLIIRLSQYSSELNLVIILAVFIFRLVPYLLCFIFYKRPILALGGAAAILVVDAFAYWSALTFIDFKKVLFLLYYVPIINLFISLPLGIGITFSALIVISFYQLKKIAKILEAKKKENKARG